LPRFACRVIADIELDVTPVLTARTKWWRIRPGGAPGRADVLLYTSRTLIRGRDAAREPGYRPRRLRRPVWDRRQARPARPAQVIVKGRITSPGVAVHGQGMLRGGSRPARPA
jgi:hypothetical protein